MFTAPFVTELDQGRGPSVLCFLTLLHLRQHLGWLVRGKVTKDRLFSTNNDNGKWQRETDIHDNQQQSATKDDWQVSLFSQIICVYSAAPYLVSLPLRSPAIGQRNRTDQDTSNPTVQNRKGKCRVTDYKHISGRVRDMSVKYGLRWHMYCHRLTSGCVD